MVEMNPRTLGLMGTGAALVAAGVVAAAAIEHDRAFGVLVALLGVGLVVAGGWRLLGQRDAAVRPSTRRRLRGLRERVAGLPDDAAGVGAACGRLLASCERAAEREAALRRTGRMSASSAGRRRAAAGRAAVTPDLEASLDRLEAAVDDVGAPCHDGDDLAQARADLDRQLDVARATEQRVREMVGSCGSPTRSPGAEPAAGRGPAATL